MPKEEDYYKKGPGIEAEAVNWLTEHVCLML